MKVVHVIVGLGVGGAELMLKRLVLELNKQDGIEHSVISLTEVGAIGNDLQKEGVNVVALGMRKRAWSFFFIFLKLRAELRRESPDIVQTWMYHADFMGGLAARSLGINQVIWGVRTTDVKAGRSKFTIVLRAACAHLSHYIPKKIVCAAHASKDLHEKIGYNSAKMEVIPNGFDLNRFKLSIDDRVRLRESWGVSGRHVVIGSVGRFNPVKNQKLFVEMASILKGSFDDVRFLMVGRDNTWDNEELVGWIKEYGLCDKFILAGECSNIPSYFSAMDVFCLHSKTEGFPNVLGEAMSMGLPCVATDVGDAARMLEKKYLCDLDAISISEKIKVLREMEPASLKSIGEENHRLIVRCYSMDRVLKAYSMLYKLA